jgi:hypothetical protein
MIWGVAQDQALNLFGLLFAPTIKPEERFLIIFLRQF